MRTYGTSLLRYIHTQVREHTIQYVISQHHLNSTFVELTFHATIFASRDELLQ